MYLGDKENLEGIIEYLRGREAFSSDLTRLQVEDLIEEETHCRWGIIKRAYEAVYSEGDAMRPKACDDWIGVGWGVCILPEGHEGAHCTAGRIWYL